MSRCEQCRQTHAVVAHLGRCTWCIDGWSTWTVRGYHGTVYVARARRNPHGRSWEWTGMPSAWARRWRDRLNAASQNLGLGPMPPMQAHCDLADAGLDLGLLLAAHHPELLDGSEVMGELGLDGTVHPVPILERVAVHPPLPWETDR